MEDLYGSLKKNRSSIFTDPSHRMTQRPPAPSVHVGKGVGFQDFGSSFAVRGEGARIASRASGSQSSTSSPTRRTKPGPSHALRRASSSASSSDDELLLSQGSSRTASNHISKRKKPELISPTTERTARVTVDGKTQQLPYHPDFKPNNALKSLKFSKKKAVSDLIVVEDEQVPPSSSNPDIDPDETLDLFQPISKGILGCGDSGPRASTARNGNFLAHRNSRSPFQSSTCMPKVSATSKAPTEPSASKDVRGGDDNPAPKVHPRPKPRVVYAPRQSPSPETTPRASKSRRRTKSPPRTKSPMPSDADCASKPQPKLRPRPRIKQKPPEPMRKVPQEFPMSLSAKENLSDGGNGTDNGKITNKIKNKGKSKLPAPQAKTCSFPIPSPLHTRQQSPPKAMSSQPEGTFPTLSPLSKAAYSACAPKKDVNGTGIHNADEDGTSHAPGFARTGADIRPFPMSTRLLESINRRSPGSPAKRLSDDSDAGGKRASKKHKDSRTTVPDGLDYVDNLALADDSIDIGYAKDPSTLCPYCDEPLPPHPTPSFQSLLSKAGKKSRADPRPRNPEGLAAPLAIYISVCQRHRFESHQLPIALERGWPQTINFKNVPMRVKRMKPDLEAIIMDDDDDDTDNDVVGDIDEDCDTRGPRSRSVFWKEVKREVKKQGSRTTVGVKGQFASFEKIQPGYYGEQGSVIIHQTLFNLFPPSSFDSSLIKPLTPSEFIQRVLVPETAARLIAQDLGVDMDYAIVTLHESARYGVAMFPDTGGYDGKRVAVDEDDEMGVADQIVMERARARRKELEEEERVEEDMIKEEVQKKARTKREEVVGRIVNAQEAVTSSPVESDDLTDRSETSTRSQSARRKPRMRVRDSPPEVDSEASEAMVVDSSSSKRRLRSSAKPPNKMYQERHSATSHDFEPAELMDVSKRGKGKNPLRGDSPRIVYPADDDQTPRPSRRKESGAITVPGMPTESNPSSRAVLPLQIARNRKATAAGGNTSDQWYRNLRTTAPDDSDDCSGASRTGRKSRPAVRRQNDAAAEMKDWLLTESSSCES
ncbi:RTC4-like domain-containing protein [Pisolithus thermaeus]|nr:RTC4-like domain-containing protein [Pisolithus thermaeus]